MFPIHAKFHRHTIISREDRWGGSYSTENVTALPRALHKYHEEMLRDISDVNSRTEEKKEINGP